MIDGKAAALALRARVAAAAADLKARHGVVPCLVAVLVGNDPASEIYVRSKGKATREAGLASVEHHLPAEASEADLLALVGRLNADPAVDGILVQLPLPPQIAAHRIIEALDPAKDVDGFHPVSAGRLLLGQPGLRPCTPAGVMRMLDDAGIELRGRRALVLGRSNIVGKPMALLLLERHATVTICHSRTVDLAEECRRADVLVVAIGRPHFVTPDMVRPGAAVIDVGVTPVEGRLKGDVDPAVAEVAGWLSPVPGGVGLMTRAMLMHNTLLAEEARRP